MGSLDDYKVDVPEGECDGAVVKRFEVTRESLENLRLSFAGRGCIPGTYTQLTVDGVLWMSDTTAEIRDHLTPILQARRDREARRVLINGLGLGMVLKAILAVPWIEHVDVVEIDKRVISLVGPTYTADPRVNIIEADAYAQAKAWPPGTRWDLAWHDIWTDPSTDTLDDMTRLHRSYGRRVRWQGSWGREMLLRQRRHDNAHGWW
jgi:hypothetical protein